MSLLAMPFPMRVLLAPNSGLLRFLRHLLVHLEEIGARLGIYGRLSRSVNQYMCSFETAIHPLLYSDRLRVVDVLTATNCLLKARRNFFSALSSLFYPENPEKKEAVRMSVFINLYTCITARVNITIVSSFRVHLNCDVRGVLSMRLFLAPKPSSNFERY